MSQNPLSTPQTPLFVAYYRVSTEKQGRSGLGLDAQIHSVEQHVARSGGAILRAFREIETGKRDDRPELQQALALCRQKKAILVIAKLDRLSRNLAFIANLIESHVEFIACDMPQANTLTLHIMAAMAQHEREAISTRIKEALAIAKKRGTTLGNPRPNIPKLNEAWQSQTQDFRDGVYPLAKTLRDRGLTLREVAQELNERHIKTCHNRLWHPATVNRLLLDGQNKTASI